MMLIIKSSSSKMMQWTIQHHNKLRCEPHNKLKFKHHNKVKCEPHKKTKEQPTKKTKVQAPKKTKVKPPKKTKTQPPQKTKEKPPPQSQVQQNIIHSNDLEIDSSILDLNNFRKEMIDDNNKLQQRL